MESIRCFFLVAQLKRPDFGEVEPEFYLSKICNIPSPKKYGPNIWDDVFFVLVPRCFYDLLCRIIYLYT